MDSNQSGSPIQKWRNKNHYYHAYVRRILKFHIPEQASILDLSCTNGDILTHLNPSHAMSLDIEKDPLPAATPFDYILLNGTLNKTQDIQSLLEKLSAYCSSDTRLIFIQYNPLWEKILKLAEKVHLKMPEELRHWLSADDIDNFLAITNYQPISRNFFLLLPRKIPLLSSLVNGVLAKLPWIRRLNLIQIIIARPIRPPDNIANQKVSVVVTCRDERDNIEPLVQRTPSIGQHTELIFVEGHSKDGTREEIEKMIKKYPEKDIVLLIQDGIGQGDAFRKGFDHAKGDFVMWLEGDLTTPPEEIAKFWEVYRKGLGEYLNGSRLVYRMRKESMPLVNLFGNRMFGNLFTILLGQRFTDTLCGLKGLSKRNYLEVKKNFKQFGDFDPFGDFELIFGVIKNNLKVVEVPVNYQPREYGNTKTHPFKHGYILLKMCWVALCKFKLW